MVNKEGMRENERKKVKGREREREEN